MGWEFLGMVFTVLVLLLGAYLSWRIFVWDKRRMSPNALVRTAEIMRDEGILIFRDQPFRQEIVLDPRVEPRVIRVQEVPEVREEDFGLRFDQMIRFPISKFREFEIGMPLYWPMIVPDPKGKGSIAIILQLFPVFSLGEGFWRLNRVEDEDPISKKPKLRPLRSFDFVVQGETVGWVLPKPNSKLDDGVGIKAPVSGLIVAKQVDNGEEIDINDVPMVIGKEVKRFPLKEDSN